MSSAPKDNALSGGRETLSADPSIDLHLVRAKSRPRIVEGCHCTPYEGHSKTVKSMQGRMAPASAQTCASLPNQPGLASTGSGARKITPCHRGHVCRAVGPEASGGANGRSWMDASTGHSVEGRAGYVRGYRLRTPARENPGWKSGVFANGVGGQYRSPSAPNVMEVTE